MITIYPLPHTLIAAYFVIGNHENNWHSARAGIRAMNQIRGYPKLTMPCGEICAIQELPTEDIHCPCGNPSHFFVKYILAPYNEKGIRN
jgi:hypothetical protein